MRKNAFVFSILLLNLVQALAQADCDRACLTGIIDRYFEGLTGNTTLGVPVAGEVRITENGKERSLPETFWEDAVNEGYTGLAYSARTPASASALKVGKSPESIKSLIIWTGAPSQEMTITG